MTPVATRIKLEEVDVPDPLFPEPSERTMTPEPTAPKPGVTFTVHALLDGFPVDVSFVGKAEQLEATIARLIELGAVPPSAQPATNGKPADGPPRCNLHKRPMKESDKRPGTYFCTAKLDDGTYCKECWPAK